MGCSMTLYSITSFDHLDRFYVTSAQIVIVDPQESKVVEVIE